MSRFGCFALVAGFLALATGSPGQANDTLRLGGTPDLGAQTMNLMGFEGEASTELTRFYRGGWGWGGGYRGWGWGWGGYRHWGWGGYRGWGWGGYRGWGWGVGYRPWVSSYYYPSYYYSYYPSYYYSPPVYSGVYYYSPCATTVEPASADVVRLLPQAQITVNSSTLRVPSQAPQVIIPRTTVPADTTYPYDGGPRNVIPMPQPGRDPEQIQNPARPNLPLEGRFVSLPMETTGYINTAVSFEARSVKPTTTNPATPRATRLVYPAYGESR